MRISKETPMVIETPRLYLREATLSDLPSLVQYLQSNQSFHEAWEPIRPRDYDTPSYWEDKIKVYDASTFEQRGCQMFLLTKDEGSRIIGSVNFSNVIRGCFHACTLGYALDQRHQGQGLMSEALRGAIDYVFKTFNLHRIQANYMVSNARSAKVLSRLGFEVEGQAKQYLRINGQWEDHVLTSIMNTDWVEKQS